MNQVANFGVCTTWSTRRTPGPVPSWVAIDSTERTVDITVDSVAENADRPMTRAAATRGPTASRASEAEIVDVGLVGQAHVAGGIGPGSGLATPITT